MYSGAGLGVLAWLIIAGGGDSPLRRARRVSTPRFVRVVLVLTAIPTVISVAIGWSGVADDGNVLRAVLAVPLGAAITAVVAAVAAGDLR
jgi:hypothetical protein